MSMWSNLLAVQVYASDLQNPLEDQTVIDYIFSFLAMLGAAALPFIVIAFILAGLYFIVARGKAEGLQNASEFTKKVFIYSALILGAGLIVKMLLSFIMELYRSL